MLVTTDAESLLISLWEREPEMVRYLCVYRSARVHCGDVIRCVERFCVTTSVGADVNANYSALSASLSRVMSHAPMFCCHIRLSQ